MELLEFTKLMSHKKRTIFTIVFTVLVLVLAVSFVMPKKYGSELQVIIIQNNLNNTDPYLVSKSSEHLGNIFSKVIYSGSFYKRVMESGFGISDTYFGESAKEQLKTWSDSIGVRNVEDTGILYVSAVHSEREQAELMVEAIGYVLKTYHTDYHGSGENVDIKIINDPVTSNLPVKPNVVINALAGFIFSFFFSLVYIYLFPETKHDLKLLPERNRGNKAKKKPKRKLANESIYNNKKPKEEEERDESSEDEMGGYFDEDEIYQDGDEDESGEIDDDLELDYDEIEKKGNINNIL